MIQMPNGIAASIALALAAAGLSGIAAPTALATQGQGGKPTVEREVVKEVLYSDDLFLDVCGVETNTTFSRRTTTKTFPDGSQTVQRGPHPFLETDPADVYC